MRGRDEKMAEVVSPKEVNSKTQIQLEKERNFFWQTKWMILWYVRTNKKQAEK